MPCGAGTSLLSDPSLSSAQFLSVTLVTKSPRWDTVSQVLPHKHEQGPCPACSVLCQCSPGCLSPHRDVAIAVLVLALSTVYRRMSSNDLCPDIHVSLWNRKSGQLYNAEVCGEVCALILAFSRFSGRKNTELLQGHLSFMSAWILSRFGSPIQTQHARLWQKASWDWERQHFCYYWRLQYLFGKAATSMEQGLSREKGSLATCACTALFSRSLGLKICHHNWGGDPSHVGISWPVVMDAQVLVAAVGSYLYCSYLCQWRCPLPSLKCWSRLCWWMLLSSDLLIKVTSALAWSEDLCWSHWSIWSWWKVLHGKMSLLSLTASCSGLWRNH